MIEAAGPAHADWLAAVHSAAFPAPEAWSGTAFTDLLRLPGVFGLMHRDGGLLLARVVADEAEILTLAVAAGQRRRGLARGLMQAAQDLAAQAGAAACYLEVAETNAPACRLYDGLGYRLAGRRRAYYPDGVDALNLRLSLDRGAATGP